MKKSLYSVFDTKAAVFANPYTSTNDQTALRDFARAATDPSSNLCAFPGDYMLFNIGSYDDNTGVIEPLSPPVNLGSAAQFKEV